tara:strand:- start:76 stop:735 length:660 start_codon:yes stop_codon:yes gene_type:complete
MSLIDLQKELQYKFNNIELLELALIHKSSNNSLNNERLEFLGDAILNSVISMYLFKRFPNEKEGLLTRMRSHLVKGETLTNKANEIGLINFIKLSKGTANLSENRKHSILEGSIESIIGAVFLDGSWEIVNDLIISLFNKELSAIESNQEFRDSKTELQELLQSKKSNLPKYVTKESSDGFESSIKLDGKSYEAYGNSKRQAEAAVAKVALDNMKSNNA